MAFQQNEDSNGVYTTVVRNTFIDVEFTPTSGLKTRSASVPALWLCEDSAGTNADKTHAGSVDFDASTEAQSTCPTCSECGSPEGASVAGEDRFFYTSETSGASTYADSQTFTKPSRYSPAVSTASEAKHVVEDADLKTYKKRFAEVVAWAKKAIKGIEHVASVQVSDSPAGWTVIIQPQGVGDEDGQTDALIAKAKEALLDAATKSKCVYLMGYCTPNPFSMRPQGFEATLGAMENAKSACWHVFKKGFCRHGDTCSKRHAACTMSVEVLVEGATFNAIPSFASAFKQEVADVTLAVTAGMESCTYADKVETFKDKSGQGWTIEVLPKEELKPHKEYLVSLAKNLIFSATSNSNNVYIMGYSAKPFMEKPQGFVTVLGAMQDESKACWDFYSKGACSRSCECRWEHAECLMPVNIVIKERPSLKCSPAVKEYLVGKGLMSPASHQ